MSINFEQVRIGKKAINDLFRGIGAIPLLALRDRGTRKKP
jgi:hypothetical protein